MGRTRERLQGKGKPSQEGAACGVHVKRRMDAGGTPEGGGDWRGLRVLGAQVRSLGSSLT